MYGGRSTHPAATLLRPPLHGLPGPREGVTRISAFQREYGMLFRQIFDASLAQYAYLIGCQRTGEALVIDPERDIDRYLKAAADEELRIVAVAETHIHADFLSGARELAEHTGARVYVSGEGGPDWQFEWAKKGAYDAHILSDGYRFQIGQIDIRARFTPCHTP